MRSTIFTCSVRSARGLTAVNEPHYAVIGTIYDNAVLTILKSFMLLLEDHVQPRLVIYFQVHQPQRLAPYSFFDIGSDKPYFNDSLNRDITQRIAARCYIPANSVLLEVIRACPEIKVNFSISGTALDLFGRHAPQVIDSFGELISTGSVELLAETSHHSLSSLLSEDEFAEQLYIHHKRISELFGVTPRVARNTELIYNDRVGDVLARLGYAGTISEVKSLPHPGAEFNTYTHPQHANFRLLLRSNNLSDAISFRYHRGNTALRVNDYVQTLYNLPLRSSCVLLALDYETFGEHFRQETGILKFLRRFLMRVAGDKQMLFSTASEAAESIQPRGPLSIPGYTSWADEAKDLSAWLGNDLQQGAFNSLKKVGKKIVTLNQPKLTERWRHLQTSDHFYYMCTKGAQDGDVHSYFSHYNTPYEAYINFMNVIRDLELTAHIDDTAQVSALKDVHPVTMD